MQASTNEASVLKPYDELFDGEALRDHWQIMQPCLSSDFSEINRLYDLAESLLRDDGATYSVYGDPAGLNRPWPLDLPPVLIPQDEWDDVSHGISQRAHLLNLILQDIYGPQKLLRHGVIPSQLIFGHPGYLRSWVGACDTRMQQLIIYGLDLARHPDGQFQVIGDRMQNPSGSGYALENRVVMARVMPELFRDAHVLRLARYFRALREHLSTLVGAGNDNPRIALLTPGSRNESYFEQAFLASYLGISLVEGQDLHVHKGKVWIRSLETEEPVDVIIRRVDDDYCDPLEFRGDSLLGVSGIAEAARRGEVAIVNPLGSGVLENPGLFPYMQKIAAYFGESEPALPQIESWWCGDSTQRQFVLEHLDSLIIKPVWRGGDTRSVSGRNLDREALQSLKKKILASPENWAAQKDVPPSLVAGIGKYDLQTCSMILRGFAVAGDDGYSVMAGGLTRVGATQERTLVSNQSGSRSKDTWILSTGPESEVSLWIHPQHKLRESAPERLVQGRNADNLFWMGRYAERSELQLNLMRLIGRRLGVAHSFNDIQLAGTQRWLMRLLTELSQCYPGFNDNALLLNPDKLNEEFHRYCTDVEYIGSLAFNLLHMISASRKLQPLLSAEMRRVTGEIGVNFKQLQSHAPDVQNLQLHQLLTLKDQMLAFNCLTGQSMIRGLTWRFLDIGRRIERAQSLLRLMQLLLVENLFQHPAYERLNVILALTDNDVNYHQRYAMTVTFDRVLDLLLLEVNNPRSLAYQLGQLETHCENLPGGSENNAPVNANRLIIEANTRVRLANSIELSRKQETTERRTQLQIMLSEIQQLLFQAGEEIADNYFDRISEQQQTLSPVIR